MNFIELARSLAMTMQKYKPARSPDSKTSYPSQTPEKNRLRYEKMMRKRPMTKRRKEYGRIHSKELFEKLGAELGCSESAARMRYYRKTIKKETVKKVRKTLDR